MTSSFSDVQPGRPGLAWLKPRECDHDAEKRERLRVVEVLDGHTDVDVRQCASLAFHREPLCALQDVTPPSGAEWSSLLASSTWASTLPLNIPAA